MFKVKNDIKRRLWAFDQELWVYHILKLLIWKFKSFFRLGKRLEKIIDGKCEIIDGKFVSPAET